MTLLDQIYSCRFGSFLGDSEFERRESKINDSTPSFWLWIADPNRINHFKNPYYQFSEDKLKFLSSTSCMNFWIGYYCRFKNLGQTELPSQQENVNFEIISQDEILKQILSNENSKHIIQEAILKMIKETKKPVDSFNFLVTLEGNKLNFKIKEIDSNDETQLIDTTLICENYNPSVNTYDKLKKRHSGTITIVQKDEENQLTSSQEKDPDNEKSTIIEITKTLSSYILFPLSKIWNVMRLR